MFDGTHAGSSPHQQRSDRDGKSEDRPDQADVDGVERLADREQDGDDEENPPRGHGRPSSSYLMSVSILNIGRYIEITIVPTMTPTPIIRIGSMMDVSDWMLESTSSS
jgi:hypothetical protein